MSKWKVCIRRTTMELFEVESNTKEGAETIAQKNALTGKELRTFQADDKVEVLGSTEDAKAA